MLLALLTVVRCALLSGFHENSPHSTLAFSPPFILGLECSSEAAISLRSPPFLGLTTVSLLPGKIRLPSPGVTYFTRPLPPHLCHPRRYWPYPASESLIRG
ncbi:unnamed protein product [Protopolystoma xenopodis]|uniref:Secreted protein n=1 Tax=Protopolystoma xenopodis TaxID=117903 RepID=A0A448WRT9_9PLAT|nr:unnamed protein product [Protopolystoma xenopodis]